MYQTPKEEVEDKEGQSEQAIEVDAENKEGLSEKMGEQRLTSPLLIEVPLPKQDGEMDTDNNNLIEENEKLRKMM